jgi:hypothetical protein
LLGKIASFAFTSHHHTAVKAGFKTAHKATSQALISHSLTTSYLAISVAPVTADFRYLYIVGAFLPISSIFVDIISIAFAALGNLEIKFVTQVGVKSNHNSQPNSQTFQLDIS